MSHPHGVVRASPWWISNHSALLLSLGNGMRRSFPMFRFLTSGLRLMVLWILLL